MRRARWGSRDCRAGEDGRGRLPRWSHTQHGKGLHRAKRTLLPRRRWWIQGCVCVARGYWGGVRRSRSNTTVHDVVGKACYGSCVLAQGPQSQRVRGARHQGWCASNGRHFCERERGKGRRDEHAQLNDRSPENALLSECCRGVQSLKFCTRLAASHQTLRPAHSRRSVVDFPARPSAHRAAPLLPHSPLSL